MLDPFDPNTWIFNETFRMYAGANADIECLVDEEDYLYFTQWLWKPHRSRKKIYFCRTLTINDSGRIGSEIEYLHIEICKRAFGPAPTRMRRFVDHWNGNSLDSRRENLRWATRLENARNIFGRAQELRA